jgi:hypothetical protein
LNSAASLSAAFFSLLPFNHPAAAPTTAPTPAPTLPPYAYFTANYCSGGSAGVIRFTVDQTLNSVFDLGNYVCITLTGTTSGPSYNIDLGPGTGYIGNSCGACPVAPTPPPTSPLKSISGVAGGSLGSGALGLGNDKLATVFIIPVKVTVVP